MNRTRWTRLPFRHGAGRAIRLLALTALVATPVVVLGTGGVAAAAEVSNQDELRDAFGDDLVSEIILTANITIDPSGAEGCDHMERDSDVSLVIDGQGAFSITKDEAACEADNQEGERIFRQHGGGTITFQNVTVTGGVKIGGAGGALKTDGPVIVTNSTFSNNQALRCDFTSVSDDPEAEGCNDPFGGAIFAEGSVTISQSAFSDNHADKAGGGVFTEANIIVESSVFSGNSATFEEGCWCSGGGWLALGGSDVSGSEVSDNHAGCIVGCQGSGGGFWSAGPASVVGTTLSGNTAGCEFGCEGTGGGFSAAGFGRNSIAAESIGGLGAAAADPGQILVEGSTFIGNVAVCGIEGEGGGGGFDAAGNGSTCGSGGGFYGYEADLVSVYQSTFTGNQARCLLEIEEAPVAADAEICGFGGGIFTQYVSEIVVDSSTFNENSATLGGGAISTGALFIEAGLCEEGVECGGQDLEMVNNTVTANTSGIFGAINALGSEDDSVTLVHNTIVANLLDLTEVLVLLPDADPVLGANITAFQLLAFGNIVVQGTGVGELAAVTGNCLVEVTTSDGYNFSDDDTCGFDDPTDNVDPANDPELLALGNYGGPTMTMRPEGEIQGTTLVSLSPVVDQIPAAACVVDVDQRGVSRPQFVIADACDIGSVEITAAEITISPEIVTPVPLQPRFTG
jgi:predicted outer membrane repeat protein